GLPLGRTLSTPAPARGSTANSYIYRRPRLTRCEYGYSIADPRTDPRPCCLFSWNRDPATGLMCVQSGPRCDGSRLASDMVGGFDWDAGCGDDRQDTPGVFFTRTRSAAALD